MAEGSVQLMTVTAQDKASATIKTIGKNIDSMAQSLENERKKVELSAKQYDIYRLSQMKAGVEVKKHVASLHDQLNAARQAAAMTKLHGEALRMNEIHTRNAAKATGFMNGQLRFMRGGLGQVGHQVQDVAVQLQMGQNAMLVFGQQGSQIASLFGPHGALIGAFLAVGAALSMAIAPSFFGASKAAKDLDSRAKNLVDSFDDLEGELKAVALAMGNEKVKEYKTAVKDAKEEIEGFIERNENLSGRMKAAKRDTEELAAVTEEYRRRSIIGAAAIEETTKKIDDRTDSTQALLDNMREEVDQLGMNSVELAIYAANKAKANAEDLVTITRLANTKQAREDEIEAVEDFNKRLKRELDSRAREEEKVAAAEVKRKLSIEQSLQKMEEQNVLLRDGKGAAAAYRLELKNATPAQIAEAQRLGDINDKLREQNLLKKQAAAQAKAAFEEESARQMGAASDFDALGVDLRGELGTPEDALRTELQTRQDIIDEFAALKVAKDGEIHEARVQAEESFNVKMKALAETNAKAQLMAANSVLSAFQSQISGMQGMVDESSALGKAFFLAQQAISAGMAIIKGFEAAATIRAVFAANPPLAAALSGAAIASGFMTAGMIAGQTIASFEGGGFTGSGPRSGGIDGRGGKLSILHPNEKVTDLTKGGGASGVTINNYIDATGDPGVELKIQQAVEMGNMQTVSTIQDLMRRGRFT